MTAKKTIFIAHNWSCDTIASISYHLALELSKEHRVVFLNAKGERKKYQQINKNLEVYDWPNKRPTKVQDLLFLKSLIQKYKPDVIVAHFSAVTVCVLGAKLFGISRSYCYYHTLTSQIDFDSKKSLSSSFKNKVQRLRKKVLYQLATGIICATKFAKQDVIKNYSVSENRIRTVYHGLPDIDKRNTYQSVSIGFLGRLDFSKGVDVLIAAVGKLINDGVEVTVEIAGAGKERVKLEQLINENGWQKRIKFAGSIPYNEVHDFICKHYMVVVPSRIDNPSIVLLEALCTQTPVIGAAAGAIPEIIDHKRTGLLFTTEDSKDLADKIKTLVDNPVFRNEIALEGRTKFENCYTIQRNVAEVKKLVLDGFN